MKTKGAIIVGIISLLSVPSGTFAEILDRRNAQTFVEALLWHRQTLTQWFDAQDVASSQRLGIEYEGVDYKFLIAYDVADSVKHLARTGLVDYTIEIDSLQDDYSLLTVSFPRAGLANQFYFRGHRCVSTIGYLTRGWKRFESKYFRFFLADTTLTNEYCIKRLELFVAQTAKILGLSETDLQLLQEEKIGYYLCRSEDDVAQLTGFRARGLAVLAYDALVSTFPTHYHELSHLLMNFRLRRLPLYTHPFLQEGFAAACGGRGGIDPRVLLPLGAFLYQTHFVELSSLLDKEAFARMDASLSYPASALMNRYLIKNLGITSYLRLYREHSGLPEDTAVRLISPERVGGDSAWKASVPSALESESIVIDSAEHGGSVVFEDSTTAVTDDGAWYHFQVSTDLLLPAQAPPPGFISKTFHDLLPGRRYEGQKYLVRAAAEEVSVRNLFSGDLIASYASAFVLPPRKVPNLGGRYRFSIRKLVFDEAIGSSLTR
jgi:hypothetical protein